MIWQMMYRKLSQRKCISPPPLFNSEILLVQVLWTFLLLGLHLSKSCKAVAHRIDLLWRILPISRVPGGTPQKEEERKNNFKTF